MKVNALFSSIKAILTKYQLHNSGSKGTWSFSSHVGKKT